MKHLHHQQFFFVCVCVCIKCLILTKKHIKTIYYYNKEKNILELWLKMSNIEVQLGHLNIADVVVKRIRKYLAKKTKYITKEEKEQYKCYFENKKGVFITF